MQAPQQAVRFLVADDTPRLVGLISELLQEAGARVVGRAGDGAEALRQFRRAPPDGVVLDIDMPELSGLDVLRAIRASEAGRGCLVIVMTGHSEPSLREQALAAGADHFLHKGTEFQRLLDIVPAWAQSSGLSAHRLSAK